MPSMPKSTVTAKYAFGSPTLSDSCLKDLSDDSLQVQLPHKLYKATLASRLTESKDSYLLNTIQPLLGDRCCQTKAVEVARKRVHS